MTHPKNATKSLNEMIDVCGDVSMKANHYCTKDNRYSEQNTLTTYVAYEAGARAEFDVLGPALKRACIALEVLGDSDSALFAKAELRMIRSILEKAAGE